MPDDAVDPGTVVLVAQAELRGMHPDAWIEGSIFERAVRLDRLNVLSEMCREAASMIEESLIPAMEDDRVPVPGLGRLEREEKQSSMWKDSSSSERMRDDLAAAVAQSVATDVATGDIDPLRRNIALHTLRTAFRAIPSFSTLNKAGREELGLHLGDYRKYSTFYRVKVVTE